MALPPLEVRYRRAALYFIVAVSGFLLIMMTSTIFLSGAMAGGTAAYLSYFVSMIILALIGFRLCKRFGSREPVMVFMSDGLTIRKKGNVYIDWNDITGWKIKTYKSSNHLIIRTAQGKTTIDISWLELPAKEIEDLMATYIRRPGPYLV
jgi:hypothetical protein